MRARNLVIGVLLTMSAGMAAANTQYLMEFQVNGGVQGEYIISERGDEFEAPSELFEEIGIPADQALPLAILEKYGSVEVDTASQVVLFEPEDPRFLKKYTVQPERQEMMASREMLEAKSLDYFVSHNSLGGTFGYVMGTGRLGPADVDLRAGLGGSESYVAAQWHDAENPWIKDIQAGRVQRYGLDGIGVSNESRFAAASFAEDRIELYWPMGTRIDVFRDGAFVETVTVDREPFFYDIELVSSQNAFEFQAILPDGTTDTRIVDRRIDGRLVGVGQVTYSLAAGEDRDNEKQFLGRIGYGLHEYASVFVGRDTVDGEYVSMLASREGLSAEFRLLNEPGYVATAGYAGQYLSLRGSVRHTDVENRSLSVQAPKVFGAPRYTMSEVDAGRYKTRTDTVSTRHGFTVPGTHMYSSLAPYFKRTERSSYDIKEFGLNGLLTARNGFRFGLQASHQVRANSDLGTTRIAPEVAFRAWPGRIAYRTEFRDDGNGFVNRRHDVNVNMWQLPWATISAGWSSTKGGGDTYTLSISGSFGRDGLSRSTRAYAAEFTVEACEDVNLDGVCQDNERGLSGVPVQFQSRQHETPVRFGSLSAYRDYEFDIGGVFGYVPPARHLKTDPLPRGSINEIRVPMRPIEEVEGQISSEEDGVVVGLYDRETGEEIATQKTAFDGWYLFYSPAGQDTEVRVVKSES